MTEIIIGANKKKYMIIGPGFNCEIESEKNIQELYDDMMEKIKIFGSLTFEPTPGQIVFMNCPKEQIYTIVIMDDKSARSFKAEMMFRAQQPR